MPDLYQIMPFLKTQFGNRPRSNGAVSRTKPEKLSGILNRKPMLNYAKGRSLSGHRAFTQDGKHRPDPTPNITANKTRNRR